MRACGTHVGADSPPVLRGRGVLAAGVQTLSFLSGGVPSVLGLRSRTWVRLRWLRGAPGTRLRGPRGRAPRAGPERRLGGDLIADLRESGPAHPRKGVHLSVVSLSFRPIVQTQVPAALCDLSGIRNPFTRPRTGVRASRPWEAYTVVNAAGSNFALKAVRTIPDPGRVCPDLLRRRALCRLLAVPELASTGSLPAPPRWHAGRAELFLSPGRWLRARSESETSVAPSRPAARKCSGRGPVPAQ